MDLRPETVVGQTCEGLPVTLAELNAAADKMQEWLKLKSTMGSFSDIIVYQLAQAYCRMPQCFGQRVLLVDIHAVLDQIAKMEKVPFARAAPTKRAAPFTVGPFKGLWRKHWFQASFLAANLLNETEKHGEMLIWKHLNEEFGRDQW